jgi:4'-phosphopantetheinyl transferase
MPKTNPLIWLLPPGTLDLQSHQVHIWRARLDHSNSTLERFQTTLSVDETERATRFHFPADRDRFIFTHGCLRDVLSRYLHCQPGQLSFSVNQYGKPALQDHELEFNLSHSGDFALIAVTRGHRVGVDVERVRQGISSHVIAQQYFSKTEFAELQAVPSKQRETAFFTCWTRKEAYIKAQGLGLSLPLESFDVSLTPNEPAILRATRPNAEEAARWTLFPLKTDPFYESAVAVEGKDLGFQLWAWNAQTWQTR